MSSLRTNFQRVKIKYVSELHMSQHNRQTHATDGYIGILLSFFIKYFK
jgi:hypothetical protein